MKALSYGPSRHATSGKKSHTSDDEFSDYGATYEAYIPIINVPEGTIPDEVQSFMEIFMFQLPGYKHASWDTLKGQRILCLHFDSLDNLHNAINTHNHLQPNYKIDFRRHYKLKDSFSSSRDFKITGINRHGPIMLDQIKRALSVITRNDDFKFRSVLHAESVFRFSVMS